MVCAAIIILIGLNIGLPLDGKNDIATKSFLPVLGAIFKLLANAAWMVAITICPLAAIIMGHRLVTAKDTDDFDALKNAWGKIKGILLGDVIAATVVSIIITFIV